MNIYDVIINVHLSEKATLLAEKFNQYTFKVRPQATKPEIKAAVETIFGKTVVKVNTCNYAGKKRRKGRTDEGRTIHWKKAYVKLKQGETLDLV